MGVSGLLSFLEKHHVGRVCHDLGAEAGGKTIVVDGQSLLFYLSREPSFGPSVDWLHGGQLLHFAYIVDRFLWQFSQNKIRLIVVWEGISRHVREEEDEVRKQNKLEAARATVQLVTEETPEEYTTAVSPFAKDVLLERLAHHRIFTRHVVGEAAPEIARYCVQNSCFSVLGQDSDYVMMPVPYIPINSLAFVGRKIVGRLFSPENTAAMLNVPRAHLGLLASLVGNNLVPYTELVDFHRGLGVKSRSETVTTVANYISGLAAMKATSTVAAGGQRQPQQTSAALAAEQLDIDRNLLFPRRLPEEQDQLLVALQQSVRRYNLAEFPKNKADWPAEVVRYVQALGKMRGSLLEKSYREDNKIDVQLINIICDGRFEVPGHVNRASTQMAILLRPLRQRLYGIAHANFNGPASVVETYIEHQAPVDATVEAADGARLPSNFASLPTSDRVERLFALLPFADDEQQQRAAAFQQFARETAAAADEDAAGMLVFLAALGLMSSYGQFEAAEWRVRAELVLVSLLLLRRPEPLPLSQRLLDLPATVDDDMVAVLGNMSMAAKHVLLVNDLLGRPLRVRLADTLDGRLAHALLHASQRTQKRPDEFLAGTRRLLFNRLRSLAIVQMPDSFGSSPPAITAAASLVANGPTVQLLDSSCVTTLPNLWRTCQTHIAEQSVRILASPEALSSCCPLASAMFRPPDSGEATAAESCPLLPSSAAVRRAAPDSVQSQHELARLEQYAKAMRPLAGLTEIPPIAARRNVPIPSLDRDSFEYEPFQLEAFDWIAQDHSVLVTAPTGSGKTEIAMRAVLHVLWKSDHGRVFYVCPTKALVHQTFAEVCARFCKQYPSAWEHMLGLVTADFRIRPHAQVIITVPQVLRLMLLEDCGRVPDMQYVVLDEIHCINSDDNGFTWEHILQLLPPQVPFVALSATIGEAGSFVDWLSRFHSNVHHVTATERKVPLQYSCFGSQLAPINFLAFTKQGAPALVADLGPSDSVRADNAEGGLKIDAFWQMADEFGLSTIDAARSSAVGVEPSRLTPPPMAAVKPTAAPSATDPRGIKGPGGVSSGSSGGGVRRYGAEAAAAADETDGLDAFMFPPSCEPAAHDDDEQLPAPTKKSADLDAPILKFTKADRQKATQRALEKREKVDRHVSLREGYSKWTAPVDTSRGWNSAPNTLGLTPAGPGPTASAAAASAAAALWDDDTEQVADPLMRFSRALTNANFEWLIANVPSLDAFRARLSAAGVPAVDDARVEAVLRPALQQAAARGRLATAYRYVLHVLGLRGRFSVRELAELALNSADSAAAAYDALDSLDLRADYHRVVPGLITVAQRTGCLETLLWRTNWAHDRLTLDLKLRILVTYVDGTLQQRRKPSTEAVANVVVGKRDLQQQFLLAMAVPAYLLVAGRLINAFVTEKIFAQPADAGREFAARAEAALDQLIAAEGHTVQLFICSRRLGLTSHKAASLEMTAAWSFSQGTAKQSVRLMRYCFYNHLWNAYARVVVSAVLHARDPMQAVLDRLREVEKVGTMKAKWIRTSLASAMLSALQQQRGRFIVTDEHRYAAIDWCNGSKLVIDSVVVAQLAELIGDTEEVRETLISATSPIAELRQICRQENQHEAAVDLMLDRCEDRYPEISNAVAGIRKDLLGFILDALSVLSWKAPSESDTLKTPKWMLRHASIKREMAAQSRIPSVAFVLIEVARAESHRLDEPSSSTGSKRNYRDEAQKLVLSWFDNKPALRPLAHCLASAFNLPIGFHPPADDEAVASYLTLPVARQARVKDSLLAQLNLQLNLSTAFRTHPSESVGCLIMELKTKNLFPAILFDLNRDRCDQLMQAIVANTPRLVSAHNLKEIEKTVESLRASDETYWAEAQLRGLLHGVGVHHAGNSPLMRLAVENLFRKGLLPIVCATGTLAVGIHMPAKCVVFVGEMDRHGRLTNMQFQQMSGRSGRRGFDTVGHVVLCGNFSLPRIQQLLTATPEVLKGVPSITPTLVLQLLRISDRDLPTALRILRNPLFSASSTASEANSQSRRLLLFALEFLRRGNLLDVRFRPTVLATAALQLEFVEPTNFLLLRLIVAGGLDDIVYRQDYATLMRILAHCSGVQLVKSQQVVDAAELWQPADSDGKIFDLDDEWRDADIRLPLPPQVIKAINAYNLDVLQCIASCARSEQLHGGSQVFSTEPQFEESVLQGDLAPAAGSSAQEPQRQQPQLGLMALSDVIAGMSPFQALSGHRDNVNGCLQFAQWKRQIERIYQCPFVSFPLFEPPREYNSSSEAVADFVRSRGRTASIMERFGISSGDLRRNLKEFAQFLTKTASLVNVLAESRLSPSAAGLASMVGRVRIELHQAMVAGRMVPAASSGPAAPRVRFAFDSAPPRTSSMPPPESQPLPTHRPQQQVQQVHPLRQSPAPQTPPPPPQQPPQPARQPSPYQPPGSSKSR